MRPSRRLQEVERPLDPNTLQSIVIVRGKEGVEVTVRFEDPRDDFILIRPNREAVMYILERRLRVWGW